MPALVLFFAALAFLGNHGFDRHPGPADENNGSRLPPASPPAPPKIDDARGTVDLTSQWTTIALKRDPQRPYVFLYASAPFRLRSNGHLYFVKGGAPVALDLNSLASVEARALSDRLKLTVVSSADAGGRK